MWKILERESGIEGREDWRDLMKKVVSREEIGKRDIEKVVPREEIGEKRIEKERWMRKKIGDWKVIMVEERNGIKGRRGAVLTRMVVMV